MKRNAFALASTGVSLLLLSTSLAGQLRVKTVTDDNGVVGLGLVLRKINTVGTLMMATAHPDDENNGLLVRLGQGEGIRTAVVTATRGDGGQNEIGPELFDALAVLRTEELLAVHRFDGAEQYFTRAVDFGYSFSREETLARWGHQEILGDEVRMIRTIRPDVITAMTTQGTGGGQHHQASAFLAQEAFGLAADPSKFPEQIREGLRPWQPKKLYFMAGFGFRREPPPEGRTTRIDLDGFDPLLGRTYAEVGTEERSMHKCQGMAQLLALPGPAATRYRLIECTVPGAFDRDETTLFDGVDTSIQGLAQYAGPHPPPELTAALAEVSGQAVTALTAFEQGGAASATPAIFAGLGAVRSLRTRLAAMTLGDAARAEIDFRLEREERLFEQAATLAYGMRFEALADDGLVVAGQPVKLTLMVANHGPVGIGVRDVALSGFDDVTPCRPGAAQPDAVYTCTPSARIPAGAEPTTIYWKHLPDADRYVFAPDVPFGVPFRPTPFRVRFTLEFPEASVVVERPVEYRYQGNIFSGEKRMEVNVVPALSVESTPEIAIVPSGQVADRSAAAREVRVTVTNGTQAAATASVALRVPAGWTVSPSAADVSFEREDEAETRRFTVTPAADAAPGSFTVTAVATMEGRPFEEGYQVIEYPHIHRRHIVRPAATRVEVVDVTPPRPMTVGYVMGVGDQVPEAIEQLGARVVQIGRDELAFGDLSKYDVIVTGVRAYERRDDLRAHNHRLLDYVREGGTLIVQYNKFEFNEAQYGPYPAKVSSNRVTDERAPVEVLQPENPIFTTPNRIGPETWADWVQERGLYFLGEKDPHYVDLVRMEDPFPYNAGMKTGALVEADYGKGHWIYVGLGLWRQLPAGTPGAYRLLANLLSVR
jgi:LmbE family N-acetylglucosaminyl deacetylase